MMKPTLIIVCLLWWAVPMHSQVSGEIRSSAGEVISYAQLRLLQLPDSSETAGTLSDAAGRFEFTPAEQGNFLLHVQASGFSSRYSAPFGYDPASPAHLQALVLEPYAVDLDEVEITGRKDLVQQTMEGTVINVQNSVMTTGSSALQTLERSPGIVIDRENNQISLNGQLGVRLMINGKIVRVSVAEAVSMLEGMSADNIEKIELLTSPSARYDADGASGLINIVLKKRTDLGTNGSASVSAGYGWAEKASASLQLNHSTEAIRLNGSYSFTHDHTFSDFHGTGDQIVPLLGGPVTFDFNNESARNTDSHNLLLGAELNPTDRLTIGLNLIGFLSNTSPDIRNVGRYDLVGDSVLNLDINIIGGSRWHNLSSTFYLEQKIGESGLLSADVDLLLYDNENTTIANGTFLDQDGQPASHEEGIYANNIRGISSTDIRLGVARVDYEAQLTPALKLETGAKGSLSQTGNGGAIERREGDDWVTDDRSTTSLQVEETIGAAYGSVLWEATEKTNLQVGFRGEYWDQQFTDSSLNRGFGRIFPSLFVSHQATEQLQLQASYLQRISRPDYNDLASFLRYNGPISVFTGNPLLQPTLTHQIKTSAQYKNLNVALVGLQENNPIVRYQVVENETGDLVFVSPQNVAWQRSLMVQVNFPWEVTDWWAMNLGATAAARRFELSHTPLPARHSYLTGNMNGSQTFRLPGDLSVEISGWYLLPFYEGSKRFEGFGMLNAGLRKEFNDHKTVLQFTVTDLLKSMNIVSYFGAVTEEAFEVNAHVLFQPESTNARIFRMSLTHRFGNEGISAGSGGQKGAKEERNRVRTE